MSLFFPSKVGGRPAWLDIRDLPAPDSLACGVCGKPPVTSLIPLSALRGHNTPNCSSYCKDRSRYDSLISFTPINICWLKEWVVRKGSICIHACKVAIQLQWLVTEQYYVLHDLLTQTAHTGSQPSGLKWSGSQCVCKHAIARACLKPTNQTY